MFTLPSDVGAHAFDSQSRVLSPTMFPTKVDELTPMGGPPELPSTLSHGTHRNPLQPDLLLLLESDFPLTRVKQAVCLDACISEILFILVNFSSRH